MPKGKRGQPSKLNPEVQIKLCDAIRGGNYYESACSLVGIHYGTFRNWMKRGRRSRHGQYFDFFQAVRQAEADAESSVVKSWVAQVPENWAAARDFLARRFPDRWGPKDKHEHSGDQKRPIRIEFAEPADNHSPANTNGAVH